MDPRIKRQRTLEAIKRILLRDSLTQPLVVIFEDLHWIDEQAQALLDLLADSIASARALLLVNYRPEYRHNWANKSYYSQAQLAALDEAGAASMLTSLVGDAVEVNPLKRMIIKRTEGNPFFIEETVQALFEDGTLVRNGTVKITRSVSQLQLPSTVQGMLAARVDRLASPRKELLQTLAVIGREAPLQLVRQVAEVGDPELTEGLGVLRNSEFVYEQPAASDIEYVFKHALTQEVAYNSLLIERRKQLHERAGQSVESLFATRLDDHFSQLAHHYRHSENVDKAIEYLTLAGQQAMQRSSYDAAIDNFQSAITLLPKLPGEASRAPRELGLQLLLNVASLPVKGWASTEVEAASVRARELCHLLGTLRRSSMHCGVSTVSACCAPN
jgi:predicted ATPase